MREESSKFEGLLIFVELENLIYGKVFDVTV